MKSEYRFFMSPSNPSITAQRGFTLMELMVVLSIVAILAAIGGPSFKNLLDKGSIQKVTSDFTMSLLLARAEAVRRNEQVEVSPLGTAWKDGWVIISGAETIAKFDASDEVDVSGPPSVIFTGNGRIKNLPVKKFTFKSLGGGAPMHCVYLSTTGMSKVLVDRDADGVCANG